MLLPNKLRQQTLIQITNSYIFNDNSAAQLLQAMYTDTSRNKKKE